MRKLLVVALGLGAVACGTKKETATLDAGLQADLATVAAPDSGLALANGNYERMRFVSSVEQVKPAVPSKHVSMTSAPARSSRKKTTHKQAPAPEPVAEEQVVAQADAPSPEPEQTPAAAPAPEPVVIAQQPSPEPSRAPVGNTGEGSAGRGNGGGGWGGIIGGIIGSVVIRGGMGGVDHCDPRTDGRNRPSYPSVPISRQPVVNGGRIGGHRY